MPEFEPRDLVERVELMVGRRRPSIFAANAMYMFLVMGLVILGLLLGIIELSFPFLDGERLQSGLSALYEVSMLALPVVIYAACHRGVSRSMRLNPPPFSAMCIAAAAGVVGVFLMEYVGILWAIVVEQMGGRITESGVAIPTTKQALVSSVFMIGVVPGICEELMFRGVVLAAWERRGAKTGLIVSSILFALTHGSILGLPAHLLLGLALGLLVILSDSIYVGMTFHTVYNSTLMIMAFLYSGSGEIATESYYSAVGGMAGVLQIVMSIALTGILFSALLFSAYASSKSRRELTRPKVKQKMNWRELILIVTGLMTVLAMYLLDLLRICWVLI